MWWLMAIIMVEELIRHGDFAAKARPLRPVILRQAKAAGVPPSLLAALLWQESGFNPAAKGAAGERGLGQLMPAAVADIGASWSEISDPANVEAQIAASARFLALQLKRSGGDLFTGLRSYNAGAAGAKKNPGLSVPYATAVLANSALDFIYTFGGDLA
jgi:soluble lytic murein transglycosylase-like protein